MSCSGPPCRWSRRVGTANALRPFGLAALTFPFVLVTWILLLASYGFSGLPARAFPPPSLLRRSSCCRAASSGVGDYLKGVLLSISQVFLKGSGVSALLILAGLAVSSIGGRSLRSGARSSR